MISGGEIFDTILIYNIVQNRKNIMKGGSLNVQSFQKTKFLSKWYIGIIDYSVNFM
jgi:hypothetical protein